MFKKIIPIKSDNNVTSETIDYLLVKTSFGLSLVGQITPIFLQSIRIFLAMFVLTGINILNVIEFRKRYSTKTRLSIQFHSQNESIYIFILFFIYFVLLF